jgi:serine/threonine protein kinase
MAEEGGRSRTVPEQDDSFEALLKQAAHVSGPSASSPASQLGVGSTLLGGRLRVRRRIGEGGMGVVYEAHDERRRGAVALKTLSRLDAGNVYRLKNEFRSLADVSHPSLVRLHELFGEGEQWFFTMELIDGERFDRWVRRHDNACEGPGHEGQLDEARLRAALPQLVAAIAAIHAAGKLHRDLKPSNVLVTVEGRVVVLDFGLVVDPELGGVGQTVLDDSVSGTPAYMAPEQAAGTAASAASDFYALGVMLFEALTGKLPFEGRAHDMLVDKQRLPAPVAAQWCPDVPHDLGTLCEALLRRDPSTRPDASLLHTKLGVPDESARLTGTSARQSGVARSCDITQVLPSGRPACFRRHKPARCSLPRRTDGEGDHDQDSDNRFRDDEPDHRCGLFGGLQQQREPGPQGRARRACPAAGRVHAGDGRCAHADGRALPRALRVRGARPRGGVSLQGARNAAVSGRRRAGAANERPR